MRSGSERRRQSGAAQTAQADNVPAEAEKSPAGVQSVLPDAKNVDKTPGESSVLNDIEAMRRGDEAALERTIDRYLPLVKGVVTKILAAAGRADLAPECVNDTFFSVWKNIGKFRGQYGDGFRKWVCAVAKYRAIDAYRMAVREASRRASETEDGAVRNGEAASRMKEAGRTDGAIGAAAAVISAEDEVIREEEWKELLRLLDCLSATDRTIFELKFFSGFSTEEIAEKMGLTATAVDNRVYRGRKRLGAERLSEMRERLESGRRSAAKESLGAEQLSETRERLGAEQLSGAGKSLNQNGIDAAKQRKTGAGALEEAGGETR